MAAEQIRIRRAEKKDLPMVHKLLREVLEVHASIRPDLFISGTTKYTDEELLAIFADEATPVFVAANDKNEAVGHCFCQFQEPAHRPNMIDRRILYIDDLCVDESARGMHVGSALYRYVKDFARDHGCYEVTLHVWRGNDSARTFYERMGMVEKETCLEEVL